MPVLGEIARSARERIPNAWLALAKSPALGEDTLQSQVDKAKYELFGSVVDADEELALYGPIGVDYAGVVVCLRLAAAGYEHWMNQAVQMGATGKNETKTFIDRANAFLKLRDEILIPEERRLYPLVQDILPGVLLPQRTSVMLTAQPTDAEHITPDPLTFEPSFERPRTAA